MGGKPSKKGFSVFYEKPTAQRAEATTEAAIVKPEETHPAAESMGHTTEKRGKDSQVPADEIEDEEGGRVPAVGVEEICKSEPRQLALVPNEEQLAELPAGHDAAGSEAHKASEPVSQVEASQPLIPTTKEDAKKATSDSSYNSSENLLTHPAAPAPCPLTTALEILHPNQPTTSCPLTALIPYMLPRAACVAAVPPGPCPLSDCPDPLHAAQSSMCGSCATWPEPNTVLLTAPLPRVLPVWLQGGRDSREGAGGGSLLGWELKDWAGWSHGP
uniref:Uncharacterized protein n=1 Tax=Gopherus agassizii TaxID=38772 RepID=A0A452I7D1_9SAUR